MPITIQVELPEWQTKWEQFIQCFEDSDRKVGELSTRFDELSCQLQSQVPSGAQGQRSQSAAQTPMNTDSESGGAAANPLPLNPSELKAQTFSAVVTPFSEAPSRMSPARLQSEPRSWKFAASGDIHNGELQESATLPLGRTQSPDASAAGPREAVDAVAAARTVALSAGSSEGNMLHRNWPQIPRSISAVARPVSCDAVRNAEHTGSHAKARTSQHRQ